jgi:hypothetical protein
MRCLGYSKDVVTSHGFRATAVTRSTKAVSGIPMPLSANSSMRIKTKSDGAYLRGEFWPERVRMMNWWADYLDGLRDRSALVGTLVE